MSARPCYVGFIDKRTKEAFKKLEKGKFEDKQLLMYLNKAIDDLKKNPECGIHIPKHLWPREYIKKYKINNLWKYDLPNAWRLIYTIMGDEVKILAVILEWLPHKEYERRFRYMKKS